VELNEYKTELAAKYALMRNNWRGLAGEAFEERAHKLIDELEMNIGNLRELITDLEQAGRFMQETDQNIAGAIKASGAYISASTAAVGAVGSTSPLNMKIDTLPIFAATPGAINSAVEEAIKNEWQKLAENPGAGNFFTALGETLKIALTEPSTQIKTNRFEPAHLIEGIIDGVEGMFAAAGGIIDYAYGAYISGMSHVPLVKKLLPQSVADWGAQRFAAGNAAISGFAGIGTAYDWVELGTFFIMMPSCPMGYISSKTTGAVYSAITKDDFHTFPVILERLGTGIKEQVVKVYEERGPINGTLYCIGELIPLAVGTKGIGAFKGGKAVAGTAETARALKEVEIVADSARVLKEGEIISGLGLAAKEATVATEAVIAARLDKFKMFLEGLFEKQTPKAVIEGVETKVIPEANQAAKLEAEAAKASQEVSAGARIVTDDFVNGIKVIDGKVGGKIPIDDYNAIYNSSIKNPTSDTLTMGKYMEDASSYTVKAGNTSYFDLGSDWNVVKQKYNLTDAEMFDYFNRPVLINALSRSKTIRFTHSPLEHRVGSMAQEWELIKMMLEKTDADLFFDGGFWYVK
jgi:uncharacterized protein YukE